VANLQYSLWGELEANGRRIETAKLGNRDKRAQLPAIGPELAVSGSDQAVLLSQDPAKAREFLGRSRGAAAKSLQPQTSWRWGESEANPSLPPESPNCRESTGNLPETGFRGRTASPVEARFGARRGLFP